MQQARRKDAKSSINRLMVLVEFYFTVIKSNNISKCGKNTCQIRIFELKYP